MPLKIKLSKQTLQASESSQSMRARKRRVDSDAERDYSREATEEPVRPRPKRSRTYETTGSDEAVVKDEGDNDADVNVDVSSRSRRGSKSTTSERRGSTASSSKPKRKTRQVVWTDDDDEVDPSASPLWTRTMMTSSPSPPSTNAVLGRPKPRKGHEVRAFQVEDPPTPKEMPSASRIPLKRAPSSEDAEIPTQSSAGCGAPPPKKRKLPPIKKNKTSTTSSTPAVAKPPTTAPKADSATPAKDPDGPVGVAARKPAAAMGAADFDLRDASVYASLFNKQMPDSGLNRRQREEERKKELNRMRDEARSKRAEETKHAFDLQAPHDKILRFEEKLRAHSSIAMYPNVLGAFWKDPRR
ncbi:uncharacterized protein B0H18DRAFT_1114859 [Fomitopsis serialis]|uniref:uncharacterized protein n=1 Tax=Fomitopsis serialis TaxID=139415 RepID=UPI002008C297|nr:uncharacterized protein B0H18DRAFT_1114859 [Neoantrodia serialis]KAH9935043.1 hypothetical protein B0H18DRAFT_1114859 [Neoantrodia serialis]